jgi:hypothetical protein
MVSCNQPFEEVERPAFRKLLNYVHMASHKPLTIPGHTTIKKHIMKMGEDTIKSTQKMFSERFLYFSPMHVAHLLATFQELESRVALLLDAWTSSNQHAFLATVAHYVSNEGELGTYIDSE